MTKTLTRVRRQASRRPSVVSRLVLISTLPLFADNSVIAQVELAGGQSSAVSIAPVNTTQEFGKPTHFIALINTGDVVINATLSPPGVDPAAITWGGGNQGSSNRQRLVSTLSADVFEITAMVPGQSPVRVTIHVLDATAPRYNSDAPGWPVDGGSRPPNCPKGCFGQTFMEIGFDGIVRPAYAVSPYFRADRWVFQLEWVQHVYRWFVQPSGFRIDLSEVNPRFLPLIPGMDPAESLNEAMPVHGQEHTPRINVTGHWQRPVIGSLMNHDHTFRMVLIVGILVVLPIGIYHRIRSQATGEKLDRRQEGLFILATLRPVGLVLWVGLFAYMINPSWMAWSSVSLAGWLRWTGVVVCGFASALLVWTFHVLGANLTDTVVIRKAHTFVDRGPYRFVRHPFYDSAFLLAVGGALMTANWFLFSAGGLFFVLCVIRTRTEERNLLARFGDVYRRYMEQTGRFFPRMRDNL